MKEHLSEHGTRMQVNCPRVGWVRLIRETPDEFPGTRVQAWLDLRLEDLQELSGVAVETREVEGR